MTKKQILYIEDNSENRLFVRRVLGTLGFEILEAEDGLSGIESAKANLPDLILMDIGLPDIDGLETTRRIKLNPALKKIPIIALTAAAMQGDAERAFSAGCDGYLTKPIGVAELRTEVQKYLKS